LSLGFDGPQVDDVRAAQRHYGDPYESDNTIGTATFMGSLGVGEIIDDICLAPDPQTGSNPGQLRLCSIDANSESDYFSFEITTPTTVTITVEPTGGTYADNPQAANGQCTTGNTTNATAMA